MNKLEHIKGYLARTPIYGISRKDSEYLIRVAEQLVSIVRYIELDEGNAIVYAPEALIRNMKNLDADVRELVESD